MLEIEFNPHAFYKVDERDIHLNLPITPWEAAPGSSVKRAARWQGGGNGKFRPIHVPGVSCA
ncbi:MAG: hypothetical protein R3E95_20795 [Thiolinea sp.]